MTTITDMDLARAVTLRHAIKLYADTGIRPTRWVGPRQMLQMAGNITGLTFRRGGYGHAIGALDDWIAARKREARSCE